MWQIWVSNDSSRSKNKKKRRKSVSEEGYSLRSLEHNMQAHDQQSRHVAGHYANYLPEDKGNDYYTVIPSCHCDTSHRWEKLHVLWWWKVCVSFIACICTATPAVAPRERWWLLQYVIKQTEKSIFNCVTVARSDAILYLKINLCGMKNN